MTMPAMSTNDTVILMSSGAHDAGADADEFTTLLRELCLDLMHQLHVDAEGAHHDIASSTLTAPTKNRVSPVPAATPIQGSIVNPRTSPAAPAAPAQP